MNKGRPLSELSESGVLWFINRSLFHPMGFALAVHTDDYGDVTGWSIVGNGDEVWSFFEKDDDEGFARFQETMRQLRIANGPTYN